MALNIAKNKTKSSGKKKAGLVPAKGYPARVVGIVDLGLHTKVNYKTNKVEGQQYMVRITYELLNCFMKDDDGKDIKDKPRWMSENVPITTALGYDNAPQQPWYGICAIVKRVRAITGDPEAEVGDIAEQLLGEACNVLVVHDKRGENTYANVGDVQQDPYSSLGQEAPALVNEPFSLDLSDPDLELFEKQPDFIKDKIFANLEFEGSKLAKMLADEDMDDEEEEQEEDAAESEADNNDDADESEEQESDEDEADSDDEPW
jgi:hypothetical protein